jgi:isoquinoline 1-oxidoreductase alpha subunit
MPYTIQVNGERRTVDVEAETPLLWVLRDELDLKGTKFGCGMALCGACTVHLDGVPTRACITPIAAVAGRAITTIEGVDRESEVARKVKAAWLTLDVIQCGYCQAGQVMAATALLTRNPRPTDADIDEAMGGNLCRCATYSRIRAAIKLAAGLPTTDTRGV